MDIRKIYEYALLREHEGKRFFVENGERLQHSAAVSTFKRLAAEEQTHIEFIESLLADLDAGKKLDLEKVKQMDQATDSFFDQRAISERVEQTVHEAMVPDLPILRMAYLIERDFAEFYEAAAAKAEGDAREALLHLAQWEHGHEALFKLFHDKAFEDYAQMPWGG